MSIDLACAGTAFLDLTFAGLGAVPEPGQERLATDLYRSPGGGAINAIGAARLGLSTALVSPVGTDEIGHYLRHALKADGVMLAAPPVERSAVTVVMPTDGDRAMATYDPRNAVDADLLAGLAPRAVLLGIDQLALVPAGARAYVATGDEHSQRFAGRPPLALAGARALLVNAAEARVLTELDDPEAAARRLAESAPTVVVTLGSGGALAIEDGRIVRVPGVPVTAVDTTGAGDLFAAAWVWADLHGADLEARLRWAVLYAALSVTVPTGTAGAATADRLIEEGTRRGLQPLGSPASSAPSIKEQA